MQKAVISLGNWPSSFLLILKPIYSLRICISEMIDSLNPYSVEDLLNAQQ